MLWERRSPLPFVLDSFRNQVGTYKCSPQWHFEDRAWPDCIERLVPTTEMQPSLGWVCKGPARFHPDSIQSHLSPILALISALGAEHRAV